MSPWNKGRVALETEHGVAQLRCPGTGRAAVFAPKGRCRSPSQKHHCIPAPGHSFLSIQYWPETSYEAAWALILTPPSCFSVLLKGLAYETAA